MHVKHRTDYQVPSHYIDSVDLYIDLGETETQVTSRMQVRANAAAGHHEDLCLNGQHQMLLSVHIDGEPVQAEDYTLTEDHLTLRSVPDVFTLEIKSTHKPQENTKLMGLYKSGDLFCTQCEPEGFRNISYFLDRPDVLSRFTTTIVADQERYPVLLSNGNLIDSGELTDGLHWMKWEDPYPKPCYLFAMVAGDLDYIEDYFTTQSGRTVTLRIFSEKGHSDQCTFAMTSLKKSMRWDEVHYGREYDLDLFMILAVRDFNAGAMENKGLNIFNSKYIFANPRIATDTDYELIDAVVAHEYFHNWTGDRVTCRDWFQLSLKEGLTVFRDHQFSEDVHSAVKRLDEVQLLRSKQFLEDAGPLAHPVRPDAYVEMENFYTKTVYEKGSEVVRMLHTLLGPEQFRQGMDLYFERHDGQAVTCDDFVQAMADASGQDLSQFMLWYATAGTPMLHITDAYDADQKTYTLVVEQKAPVNCSPTRGAQSAPLRNNGLDSRLPASQCFAETSRGNDRFVDTPPVGGDLERPMLIPLSMALLDEEGQEIVQQVLSVSQSKQAFTFKEIKAKPIVSLLRGFSAPVKLNYDYSDAELAFLMTHDADAFARWNAAQEYALRVVWEKTLPDAYVRAFQKLLHSDVSDKALLARLLMLPTEDYIAEQMEVVDVDAVYMARQRMRHALAKHFKSDFLKLYHDHAQLGAYAFDNHAVGKRALRNVALYYLAALDEEGMRQLIWKQFQTANNMTDRFAALSVLADIDSPKREAALRQFYEEYQQEELVIDKWFMVQAMAVLPTTVESVRGLLHHPAFTVHNPNRARALLGAFSQNPVCFHAISGEGYRLFTDCLLDIDAINPHLSARLLEPLTLWRRYDAARQKLMQAELQRLLDAPHLSKNAREIVGKSMGQAL